MVKYIFLFPVFLLVGCSDPARMDSLESKHDSLATLVFQNQVEIIRLNHEKDSLAFIVDEVVKHDLRVDSILDKEIKNISLAKKIGKRLRQVAEGAIGL